MPSLDLDRIAEAALAVADERGASGFTLKAVAERLGVTPMALYHHVENKAALVALIVDVNIREHPMPAVSADWRQGLLELARWSRELMLDHPALGELQVQHKIWTTSALALGEQWMSLWQRSGLSLESAVQAGVLSSMTTLGMLHEQSYFKSITMPDESQLAFMPNARAMYGAMLDPAASFDLVVTAVIDGLHAQLSAREKPVRAQRRSGRSA